MAQPITDYAAFFADARQAVEELEQLRLREEQLTEQEKQQESALKAKKKAVSDTISQTVKKRSDEISKSYDSEAGKAQERLKKVKAKREKAKNQGVKERISENTQSLVKENSELKSRMKTLFRTNHVPGFCRGSYYYALYFTKGLKELAALFLTLAICFLVIPCGAYFLIPERKTWYLIVIYLAAILIFGGIYVVIGNTTRIRYMDVLKEGREIRNAIKANRKKMKAIAKSIKRDKNESIYNLQKYDDEIAQLEQDLAQINRKKKDALATFDTVTRTIISDEITSNNKEELDGLEAELAGTSEELKTVRNAAKEQALYVTDHYESYVGKSFLTSEKLSALEETMKNGQAANITEAIAAYNRGGKK